MEGGYNIDKMRKYFTGFILSVIFLASLSHASTRSVSLGYAGGGGLIEASFNRPIKENLGLKFDLGFGLGSGYNVMLAGLGLVRQFNPDWSVGISADLVDYSESVADLLGLPTVDKGWRAGLGIFAIKNLGQYEVLIGYSTALGPNLSISRSF